MLTDSNSPTGTMLEELSRYVIAEPYPFVIDLEKSHGSWLATLDGRRIFDWAGYFGSKLITTGIETITPSGVVTQDGAEHPATTIQNIAKASRWNAAR